MPVKKKNNSSSSSEMDENEKVYEFYFSLYNKYLSQYGEKMAILMQVGSFFEIYGERMATGEIQKTNIESVGKMCRIEIADKKITTPQGGTVIMAGFRDYTLDKYVEILVNNDYTVVVYDQKPHPQLKNKMIREHLCTYSPGTHITHSDDSRQCPNREVSNNIMCVWMELYTNQRDKQTKLVCGITTSHMFTGETTMFEYEIHWSNCTTIYDELERYVSVFSPSEIIVISRLNLENTLRAEQLSGISNCSHIYRVLLSDVSINEIQEHNEQVNYALRCEKQVYVNQILESVYGVDVYRNCEEFRQYSIATQSFCYLLNFIQEHNPCLVKNLSLPSFVNISTRMVLANHTLQQLNIINTGWTGKKSSIHSLLDECKTSMGKRQLYRELTSPTSDVEWLENIYEITHQYLNQPESYRKHMADCLHGMIDIEKWMRELVLRKIKPRSWIGLYDTLHRAKRLFEQYDIVKHDENDEKIMKPLHACIYFVEKHLIIEKCRKLDSMTHFDTNFVQKNISKELDDAFEKYEDREDKLHALHEFLNKLLNANDYVKIHKTEKSGIVLQITSTRCELLKPFFSKHERLEITPHFSINTKTIKFKKTSSSSSLMEIQSPEIDLLIHELHTFECEWNEILRNVYCEILDKAETEMYSLLENVSLKIIQLDSYQCRAVVSQKYRLCRPSMYLSQQSGFQVHGLRHILIEQLQTNEIYVENDLEMSSGTPDVPNGLLLFGTNAVGKTSFIRALGVAVIMAQSGFYVSASSFHYCPYNAIYSRIWGNDNLFRGLSTFAVEMSELRVLLNHADENSLVLGDELCSGTENESALSIFSAGLEHLCKKKSTFLFATHFHEITKWEEVKELPELAFKHMSVHYDRSIDGLVYDRKLKDGPGNRMYGLEVCKSLHLNDDFLERAYYFRRKYFDNVGGVLSYKQSQYNANKLRGMCEKCGQCMGEEIHHMIPQECADEKGYLHGGSVHKNHAANLTSLCEKCHLLEHHSHESLSDLSSVESTGSLRKKTTSKKYIFSKHG